MQYESNTLAPYCSILTQKLHVDGCGTAPPNIKYFLFIETQKPWPENEKSVLDYPSFAFDLAKGNLKIHLLSPGDHSKLHHRTIIFFEISETNVANYSKSEYNLPIELVNDLITSLFTKNDLEKYKEYKINSNSSRDLFICGHLAKDYCCGTFGDALFRKTKDYLNQNESSYPNIKIWQTSHVKGHKFAPTMIDFPEGRFWAHLNEDLLQNYIIPITEHTTQSLENLKLHIRGLAGTNNFGQIAEREFFLKHGSIWRDKSKQIFVEDLDGKKSAKVTIKFEGLNGFESQSVVVSFSEEVITVSEHACGETSTFKNPVVTY
jgi:hypothetical protein